MGLKGWYLFLRKKGYQPSVLQPSAVTTTSSTITKRFDLLSRFSVIRDAYTRNPTEKAHVILEQDIMQFGTKENMVIYVDGVQAEEKAYTTQVRQKTRENAVVRCENAMDVLQDRINNNLKIRKRHFTDVKASMSSTFYWSLPMRASFTLYMIQAGWRVQTCETEADVAIAQDCHSGDVVISVDSDMLAYSTVSTL
ncbi:hypothetical protein BGZ52_009221, partial [Haplosporangium bisporale]